MYFFYIDESGNTGANLDSPDQPVHWLVALGIDVTHMRALEADVLALALKSFRARARSPDFELHGADVFSGRGECQGMPPANRVQLYGEILGLAAKHGCVLFVQGIHKQRHKERARERGYAPHHPHRLGFMYLLERIDDWLESRQPHADLFEAASAEYGLIIADEQKEVHRQIVARFAYWKDSGTDFLSGRELKWLVDTVHYVPSHDSWLIQLVDCVAYIRSRFHRVLSHKGADQGKYSASEAAVARLWRDHCQALVATNYMWPQ
jgi:hypothetical protein